MIYEMMTLILYFYGGLLFFLIGCIIASMLFKRDHKKESFKMPGSKAFYFYASLIFLLVDGLIFIYVVVRYSDIIIMILNFSNGPESNKISLVQNIVGILLMVSFIFFCVFMILIGLYRFSSSTERSKNNSQIRKE
jgi:hypothetical protein